MSTREPTVSTRLQADLSGLSQLRTAALVQADQAERSRVNGRRPEGAMQQAMRWEQLAYRIELAHLNEED